MFPLGSPDGSAGKESTCSAGATGDIGLIPGSGSSPRGGNGSPLHYSCLKNPTDRVAWWLQSRGLQRVGRDWVTKHTCVHIPSMPTFWRGVFFLIFYHKWIGPSVICSSYFSRALPHESGLTWSLWFSASSIKQDLCVLVYSFRSPYLIMFCNTAPGRKPEWSGIASVFSFFSGQCLKSVVSYILSCLFAYHSIVSFRSLTS